MHTLHFPNSGNSIELRGSLIVIGRNPSSDIVLDDPSVSGQHAALALDGDRYALRDLGSTNGTLVNDQPASGGQIKSGDRVMFGSIEARYTSDAAEPAQRPAHERSVRTIRFKKWVALLAVAAVLILVVRSLFSGKPSPPAVEQVAEKSSQVARETSPSQQTEAVSRDWVMVTVQTSVILVNKNRTGGSFSVTVEPGDCFPVLHNEPAGYNEVVLGFGTTMFSMETSRLRWVRLSEMKEAQANHRGNISAFLDNRRMEREMTFPR